MKRSNQSTSKQGPIQLSSTKKSQSISLKSNSTQKPLFGPYKIQWKTPTVDSLFGMATNSKQGHCTGSKEPLRNIENSSSTNYGKGLTIHPSGCMKASESSKVFYENMKNELINIKQDVQKLISKQRKERPSTLITYHESDSNSQETMNKTKATAGQYHRTISIKQKCQQHSQKLSVQKTQKIQSLYENVNRVLERKMGSQEVSQNLDNSGQKYRSENNVGFKMRSQSIADGTRKKDDNRKVELFKLMQNDLSKVGNQQTVGNQEKSKSQRNGCMLLPQQQNEESNHSLTGQAYATKSNGINGVSQQKVQVQSMKLNESETQETQNGRKYHLVEQLRLQLKELQRDISQRDELLSRKQSEKLGLIKEVDELRKHLTKQQQENSQLKEENSHLKEQERIYREDVSKASKDLESSKEQLQEKDNYINYLQLQLNKVINLLNQQQHQNHHLTSLINQQQSQTNAYQQPQSLKILSQRLQQQLQASQESLGNKLRMKENQLYIYQQELKEAKLKIKDLREKLEAKNQQAHEKPLFPPQIHQKQSIQVVDIESHLIDKAHVQQKILLTEEANRLNSHYKRALKQIQELQHHIRTIQSQLVQRNDQNQQLSAQLSTKKEEFLQLTSKYHDLQSKEELYTLFQNNHNENYGEDISKKLSSLIDENYKLKNKISHLESKLQETTLISKSLNEQLKIYQEKYNSDKGCARRLKVQDWDQLTSEKQTLQSQLQSANSKLSQLQEFYDLAIMKKENLISHLQEQLAILQSEPPVHMSSEDVDYSVSPVLKHTKHIKNINELLAQFHDLVNQNIQLKSQLINPQGSS